MSSAVGNCNSQREFSSPTRLVICVPKARKKRRLLTQSKPAILVSLCGKNPQNNGSAVYENLAYFSSKIEAPFVKSVSVSTFV